MPQARAAATLSGAMIGGRVDPSRIVEVQNSFKAVLPTADQAGAVEIAPGVRSQFTGSVASVVGAS